MTTIEQHKRRVAALSIGELKRKASYQKRRQEIAYLLAKAVCRLAYQSIESKETQNTKKISQSSLT